MKHYIILGYDLNRKNRKVVLWGNLKNHSRGMNKLYDMLATIRRNVSNPNAYSVNFVESNDTSWESVVKENNFYKDVEKPLDDVNEFIKIINNIKLSSIDVAYLILYNLPTTEFKLQRILFLVYQAYLKKYKKKLFDDEFFAWEYGPVNRMVFLEFTEFETHIEGVNVTKEDDSQKITIDDQYNDKIQYHKDKERIIDTVNEIINTYGKYSSQQLVELLTSDKSAWKKTEIDLVINDTDIFNSNY